MEERKLCETLKGILRFHDSISTSEHSERGFVKSNLPYCPSPSDPDEYVYCCQFFTFGETFPSCCRFPIYTGVVYALTISAVLLFLLLLFLYCWCWPSSLFNTRRRSPRYRSNGSSKTADSKRKRGVEFVLGSNIVLDVFLAGNVIQHNSSYWKITRHSEPRNFKHLLLRCDLRKGQDLR
ncbi:hypothetical protein RB195_021562 [Necator americanus]|uniref:Uncharacterized protein n=1 Tax=Necator americanus TaxID=51031 RepID=A0ABR1EE91_NECAM